MCFSRKFVILLLPLGVSIVSCERKSTVSVVPAPAAAAVAVVADQAVAEPVKLPEKVSFNEHIQPILSEYCYHCHGPDSGTRMPKTEPLRLDLAADALAPRANGKPVIVKGDPQASLLAQLIRSDDPDTIMPPPKSHKVLSQHEIALLERWIEQGAEYQAHWSFIPPTKPAVPATGKDWARNPIDHFIADKLAAEKLSPNPAEEPRRFFRRLHFDLTGLPPSPEAVAEFATAAAADYQAAVEAAADKLLASTAAAEHQARIWLDAARYADTHGIHIDNYRAIWPYRDWVIQAFQQNLPWDQFTIEQIAGDLLANATLEQTIATGFSRCLPTTGEGGAIPEEYEAIYAKDRVDTVSAVWLGLTTGCASCHDHKFDPISMRDFYSLSAFFRNTPMSALDGNNAEHPPNIFAPRLADRARFAAIPKELETFQAELKKRGEEAKPDFEKWLPTAPVETLTEAASGLALHLPFTEADGPLRGVADGKPLEWNAPVQRRDGPLGKAVLANSANVELGDLGAFARTDQVSYGALIYVEGAPNGAVIARMDATQMFRGWDIWLENGRVASHVIDQWPNAACKIVSPDPLEPGKWHHVMFVFDGTLPPDQTLKLYLNGQLVKHTTQAAALGKDIATAVPLRLGARHGDATVLQGVAAIQDFRFYRRLLQPAEIAGLGSEGGVGRHLAVAADQRTPEQTAAIYQHYLAQVDPVSKELRAKIAAATKEQQEIRARGSVTLIMQERPKSEPAAHILARGVYSAKGEKVPANVPAALPPLAAEAPRNRLGLAQWLVDPANPLPARVTVNRFWLQCFGSGIVETAEDFGIMGARPSHPQLLDWLATEFVAAGWNPRHILKLIVSSATYRQSAVVSPEKLEKDPYNRLLARGPRLRLEAEALRDLALAAANLLSPTVGGPSVKPYQPEGIWEAVAMKESNTRNYKQDAGESLYRRSLYTFWKRTAPPPSMEILNAPVREVTCVRRERTNTPLQALVMLNDPQFIEASRQLAANAIRSSGEPAARLDFITARLLGRALEAAEREIIYKSHEQAIAAFTAKPDDAAALITVGATPPDPAIPAWDLAAWTFTASQILNLDETLTR
jgi:hypothetical protein